MCVGGGVPCAPSRSRRAAPCSTSPAAPATCASSSPVPGTDRSRSTSAWACCAPTAAARPRVQADILRLPLPDASVDGVTCGFALRNLVDLPSFFDELGRVVRPGGRIALLDVGVPHNGVVRWGHGIYFGKVVPRIGGWLSDPAAYRYLPRSVAYLPGAERDAGAAPRCRLRRRHARRAERRHHPAPHGHPLMRAVTRIAEPDVAALDLNDVARGDGYLFVRDGVGIAGRGVAARAPADEIADLLASIDHEDATGCDVPGPLAIGWVPFEPGQARRAGRAGGVPAQDGRRPAVRDGGRRQCRVAGRAAPAGAVRVGVHDRAGDRRSTTTSPRSWRPARPFATGG